jgi:hypothetical protein
MNRKPRITLNDLMRVEADLSQYLDPRLVEKVIAVALNPIDIDDDEACTIVEPAKIAFIFRWKLYQASHWRMAWHLRRTNVSVEEMQAMVLKLQITGRQLREHLQFATSQQLRELYFEVHWTAALRDVIYEMRLVKWPVIEAAMVFLCAVMVADEQLNSDSRFWRIVSLIPDDIKRQLCYLVASPHAYCRVAPVFNFGNRLLDRAYVQLRAELE